MKNNFEPVDPFSHSRLYGSEKYSLQNMLLKQTNMPTWADDGDQIYEIWSDRCYTPWKLALKGIKSSYTHDAFFAGVSDEDFLKFAAKVIALVENQQKFSDRCKQLIEEYGPVDENDYAGKCKRTDEVEAKAAAEIEPIEITGAIIIRYTNVSSGYPCERLTTIKVPSDGKARRYGVPTSYPKLNDRELSPYGW